MDASSSHPHTCEGSVLVVDDDNLLRAVLRKIVESKGYQVLEAANAKLALEAVERFPVRLVFLDICLPDASGLDIVNQMREARDDLKVAFISGYPSMFDLPAARGDRIVDCIGKPFSLERIERVLDDVFGQPALDHRPDKHPER